jgi:hypothetical protein
VQALDTAGFATAALRAKKFGRLLASCVQSSLISTDIVAERLPHDRLSQVFLAADNAIRALEQPQDRQASAEPDQIQRSLECVRSLLQAYIEDEGRKAPPLADADLLGVCRPWGRQTPDTKPPA